MTTRPARRRAFLAFVAFLTLPLALGCQSEPTASLVGARIANLTADHVDLVFDVKVDNPWIVPLPVAEATGSLVSSQITPGTPFLQLSTEAGDPVPRRGSRTIPLKGTISFQTLLAGLSNVHLGDEVPYTATLDMALNAPPNDRRLELPQLTHNGKIPILAPPEVSIKSVSWPSLSWDQVTGNITLNVKNKNKFAIGPGTAAGNVVLKKQFFMSADKQLSSLSAAMANQIGGNQSGDLVVTASFRPKDLFDAGTWLGLAAALVDRNQLRASGTLSATTPYAPVEMNFDTR